MVLKDPHFSHRDIMHPPKISCTDYLLLSIESTVIHIEIPFHDPLGDACKKMMNARTGNLHLTLVHWRKNTQIGVKHWLPG
jgi:hypothetical protein